jgi:hypothetical protein
MKAIEKHKIKTIENTKTTTMKTIEKQQKQQTKTM